MLRNAKELEEAKAALVEVFTSFERGELLPTVHKQNHTTLAQVVVAMGSQSRETRTRIRTRTRTRTRTRIRTRTRAIRTPEHNHAVCIHNLHVLMC